MTVLQKVLDVLPLNEEKRRFQRVRGALQFAGEFGALQGVFVEEGGDFVAAEVFRRREEAFLAIPAGANEFVERGAKV